jgi:hypothetical protein
MSNNKRALVILILALSGIGAMRYGYYKYLNYKDKSDRSWAYPDSNGHMLTGLWNGQVKDADGHTHDLSIQIINPYDDKYRADRVSNKRIKRDRSSKKYFEIIAEEKYKGNTITHTNGGRLNAPDAKELNFQFGPDDGKHYEGFNLNIADGVWKDDVITLDVKFAYFTREGYSHSDSADPRHDYIGKAVLKKK